MTSGVWASRAESATLTPRALTPRPLTPRPLTSREPGSAREPEPGPTPQAAEGRSTELVPDEPALAADAPTKLGDPPPELGAEPASAEESSEVSPAEPAAAAETGGSGADDDSEGARLIALNMALNGTSRDETDRYLAENFSLADRKTLLDEVYASVEG